VEDAGGDIEQEIAVPFETKNWHIKVKNPGSKYTVEIGFYRNKSWNLLARSMTVSTPRDKMSDSDRFDFVTLPLHVSFQRLVETINDSISAEENLVPALAELQRSIPAPGSSGLHLEDRERAILVTLLGSEFLSSFQGRQWSSEELHSAIQQRLQERISSGEIGELFARLQFGQAESSLFSAFAKLGAEFQSSSFNVSSAGFAERLAGGLSSWIGAALTSWSSGPQSSWAGGGISSFSGASETIPSGASETLARISALSSWAGLETSASGAQASWSGLETSTSGALASWGELSSWLAGVSSSWSGINMSSFEQALLSSWSSAAMSSWNIAGSSSWGASENSAGLAMSQASDFIVDAEITLRGQTHPQGRVLIAGESVPVGSDGSFEHKVVFRGGRGEVPIEATAPDGSVTRRTAILL
jgi:hypothetical protein